MPRSAIVDEVTRDESDELLTTGEVARLISSSRQHVVDLCNVGDLPFVSVGRHRRIRRRDVQLLQSRTDRMTRDQRRSIWLNAAVAGELVTRPDEVLAIARDNLDLLVDTHQRGQAAHWLGEWRRLLDGPTERVVEVLTSPTPWAREMRQNSPFSGVLDETTREVVLAAFKAHEGRR